MAFACRVQADPHAVTRPFPLAFRRDEPGIRGMTIGPIESACHPGIGYGSPAYEAMLDELVGWGVNWVSLTPFGRVGSTAGLGVVARSTPSGPVCTALTEKPRGSRYVVTRRQSFLSSSIINTRVRPEALESAGIVGNVNAPRLWVQLRTS